MSDIKIEYIKLSELKAYDKNARMHSEQQVLQVMNSISEFGFTNPVLIDENNVLIAGHGRSMAAERLGMDKMPAIRLVGLSDEKRKALRIADNQLALNAGWDMDLLAQEIQDLQLADYNLDVLGFSDEQMANILDGIDNNFNGDAAADEKQHGALVDRFIVPPFSVLDTKQGYWQDRKRSWLDFGIRSEESREHVMSSPVAANKVQGSDMPTVSIFDPVLCEIIYKWFNVPNGTILDPFAGGSVRGIVAAKLGYQYVGNDLRGEQVEANRRNALEVLGDDAAQPVWTNGDSVNIDVLTNGYLADLLFSCPPYADLEVYSDDPKDLSNMEYNDFLKAYRIIIEKSSKQLKENRFAVFVVGDVRDKKGCYRNFVSDTIQAFLDCGLKLYNEIILVNAVGSLAVRAGKQFNAGRKVGKQHQNVLVFYKGDTKNIKGNYNIIIKDEELIDME